MAAMMEARVKVIVFVIEKTNSAGMGKVPPGGVREVGRRSGGTGAPFPRSTARAALASAAPIRYHRPPRPPP
jgi:hypothetical protein